MSYSTELGLRPTPAMNAKDKRDCSFSLLYAITSRKMRYTESLVYSGSRSNSLLSIDLELETMNKKDIAAFRQYKRDPIGPYIVVPAEGLGYDVKAIKEIPRGTIICEYIGEVISKRTAITTSSDNDSLMELFVTNDADTTLLIRPQINTNIARFINGVNNSDPEAWKRINLQSVRLRIEGEPRVLLYARRNIQSGESLIYDYNAGGKELFPTDGFL